MYLKRAAEALGLMSSHSTYNNYQVNQLEWTVKALTPVSSRGTHEQKRSELSNYMVASLLVLNFHH